MTARPLALAAVLVGAAALAGCGKMGALERPGPLVGGTQADASRAEAQTQDPARPVTTVDPRDRTMSHTPSRTVPIEGTPSDPGRTAPQGALEDPYANPRR